MALRDQPYMPLYVQDFLTDEKLNMCSPSSQGVYIKIMCVLHKSDEYGKLLLKQKDKQNESTPLNFAYKLAKLLPFVLDDILDAINELLDEKVLHIDGDYLVQKRMVKDADISEKRAKSGSKGGKKSYKKRSVEGSGFAQAKSEQNTEYENEYEYIDNTKSINKEKSKKENPNKEFVDFLAWLNETHEINLWIQKRWPSYVQVVRNNLIDWAKYFIAKRIENGDNPRELHFMVYKNSLEKRMSPILAKESVTNRQKLPH